MKTTITEGQSLLDVALQECGSVEALFDLADAAGLAITDALTAGELVEVPTSATARAEVVRYYAGRGQRVNTGSEPVAVPELPTGDFSPNDFSNDFLIS